MTRSALQAVLGHAARPARAPDTSSAAACRCHGQRRASARPGRRPAPLALAHCAYVNRARVRGGLPRAPTRGATFAARGMLGADDVRGRSRSRLQRQPRLRPRRDATCEAVGRRGAVRPTYATSAAGRARARARAWLPCAPALSTSLGGRHPLGVDGSRSRADRQQTPARGRRGAVQPSVAPRTFTLATPARTGGGSTSCFLRRWSVRAPHPRALARGVHVRWSRKAACSASWSALGAAASPFRFRNRRRRAQPRRHRLPNRRGHPLKPLRARRRRAQAGRSHADSGGLAALRERAAGLIARAAARRSRSQAGAGDAAGARETARARAREKEGREFGACCPSRARDGTQDRRRAADQDLLGARRRARAPQQPEQDVRLTRGVLSLTVAVVFGDARSAASGEPPLRRSDAAPDGLLAHSNHPRQRAIA